MNKALLIVVVSFFCYLLPAQEVLQSLSSDPSIQKGIVKKKSFKAQAASLSLPFFDDFSNAEATQYRPSEAYWMPKSGVKVNNNYGLNPITLGVATFDAIGSDGKLYAKALEVPSFGADTLCSLPINLFGKLAADSIYLSFFYQPAGTGEMPDASDNLMLQFHTPFSKNWDTIWSVGGTQVAPFRAVIIPVLDEKWMKDSFQFRFINTASIDIVANDPGRNTNGDIWNLDYVYLNAERSYNDSAIQNEIAVMAPPKASLLKHFESMPWHQFKMPTVYGKEKATQISIPIISYREEASNVESSLYIRDIYNNVDFEPITNSTAVDKGNVFYIDEDIPILSSDAKDSVVFEMKLSLTTDVNDRDINNTVTYYQHFNDYFSYDDGSAEFGYGISGEGATNAMLAMRFDTYSEDSLIGVQMFFNESLPAKENLTQRFALTVWNEKNKLPGDTLYKKSKESYTYKAGWQTFLLDTAIIVPKIFYVGWVQKSAYFANLGFDRNRLALQHTFFNLQGTPDGWMQSTKEGAVMIRPIVKQAGNVSKSEVIRTNISIFPNPASDYLNFTMPDNLIGKQLNVNISTLMGTLCISQTTSSGQLNISQLQNGIYLVKVTSADGFEATTKFIKTVR